METLTASTVSLFHSFHYSTANVRVDSRVEDKKLGKSWDTSPLEVLPRSESRSQCLVDRDETVLTCTGA
jgi:hypothetical protein